MVHEEFVAPSTVAPKAQSKARACVRSVGAMMLREMATSYGRSPGGYVWAVLEPAAAIALLAFVFSLAFASPVLGSSFPLFYATGFLPFLLFNDLVNKLASAIRFSRPLLAYPTVTYLDAILARFVLNLLVHVLVIIVVLGAIEMAWTTGAYYDFGPIASAVAMAAGLALGIGTLNCYLLSRFPVWDRFWQILTRPLFVISGIFFIYEDVPQSVAHVAWLNPLLHVTGQMRNGVYSTYEAAYVSELYVFALSLITLVLGLLCLRKSHRDILNS